MNDYNPKPHGRPILCLDFDGVIHSYSSGWQGVTKTPDPPVPGVFEWIRKALDYFDIYIYSSRSIEHAGRVAIWRYIDKHAPDLTDLALRSVNITVTSEKPRAFLTIDDRCVRFDGDWADPRFDPKTLAEYRAWYQSKK